MKKNLEKTLLIVSILLTTKLFAASNVHLDKANNDIYNQASLQNGANLFVNYCFGCHSISFMRYERIAEDLNIPKDLMRKNLMFTDAKIGDKVISAINTEKAKDFFGVAPPDLSLVARYKGVDWIYTFLRSFYKDDSKTFGVNNHIFNSTAMPDILWALKKDSTPSEYNNQVRDIVNFLDYVGEPVKIKRVWLGIKVLIFLVVLLLLTYLLKKEYWKDVHYGKWRQKD